MLYSIMPLKRDGQTRHCRGRAAYSKVRHLPTPGTLLA
uniref:Uncharacterized protein n=1 Tax=Lepeophtheirus salmonis TaxID=72036 RepID=A0A0K2TEB7_LEPSM